MKQIFSLRRFTQLNRWFWATNGRTYALGLLALLITTTLLLGRVLTYPDFDLRAARNNIPYFLVILVPPLSLFSTHVLSVLSGQRAALLYLMLPASRAEKFVLAMLYIFLFLAGYCLFYVAAEALFFYIANRSLPPTGSQYRSELLSTPEERLKDLSQTAYFLLIVAIISILSSLYFRQAVFIKNAVLTLGLFFGLTFISNAITSAFFQGLFIHTSNFFLLGDLAVVTTPGNYANAERLPPPLFTNYIFPWLLLAALCVTARIRFNEIER